MNYMYLTWMSFFSPLSLFSLTFAINLRETWEHSKWGERFWKRQVVDQLERERGHEHGGRRLSRDRIWALMKISSWCWREQIM